MQTKQSEDSKEFIETWKGFTQEWRNFFAMSIIEDANLTKLIENWDYLTGLNIMLTEVTDSESPDTDAHYKDVKDFVEEATKFFRSKQLPLGQYLKNMYEPSLSHYVYRQDNEFKATLVDDKCTENQMYAWREEKNRLNQDIQNSRPKFKYAEPRRNHSPKRPNEESGDVRIIQEGNEYNNYTELNEFIEYTPEKLKEEQEKWDKEEEEYKDKLVFYQTEQEEKKEEITNFKKKEQELSVRISELGRNISQAELSLHKLKKTCFCWIDIYKSLKLMLNDTKTKREKNKDTIQKKLEELYIKTETYNEVDEEKIKKMPEEKQIEIKKGRYMPAQEKIKELCECITTEYLEIIGSKHGKPTTLGLFEVSKGSRFAQELVQFCKKELSFDLPEAAKLQLNSGQITTHTKK